MNKIVGPLTVASGILFAFTSTASAQAATGTRYPYYFGPFPRISSDEPTRQSENAREVLRSNPLIRSILEDPSKSLVTSQQVTYQGVSTTKFQEYVVGPNDESIEVIGSLALVHSGPSGVDLSNHLSQFNLSLKPNVTPTEAISLASAAAQREANSAPQLKVLPQGNGSARLVYVMSVKPNAELPGADVYIDAHTGKTIAVLSDEVSAENASSHRNHAAKFNVNKSTFQTKKAVKKSRIVPLISMKTGTVFQKINLPSNAKVDVYEADLNCQTIDPVKGRPTSIDPTLCKHSVNQSVVSGDASIAAKEAFTNAKKVLEYYLNTHGRDSLDNRGTNVAAVVHAGIGFNNAFWNPKAKIMAYGDGDGKVMGRFTQALDVSGHEMTHGVVTETAAFLPMAEPGALNEAFADFFGKMIANDGDWSLGKNIFIDKTKGMAIRDLANPHRLAVDLSGFLGETKPDYYAFPATIQEMLPLEATCTDANHGCFVHENSTIWGHAEYMMVEGVAGKPGLGKEKAQKLLYLVLTQYLSAMSGFRDAAAAVNQACPQILNSNDCSLAQAALTAVGL